MFRRSEKTFAARWRQIFEKNNCIRCWFELTFENSRLYLHIIKTWLFVSTWSHFLPMNISCPSGRDTHAILHVKQLSAWLTCKYRYLVFFGKFLKVCCHRFYNNERNKVWHRQKLIIIHLLHVHYSREYRTWNYASKEKQKRLVHLQELLFQNC